MTTLPQALDEYLALRQAMGFAVRDARRLLRRFIDFLEQHRATSITSALALSWATEPHAAQPAEWSRRLSLIRGFARYRSATDPRTQIPAAGILPYRPQRVAPYLYSDTEIEQLLQAAAQLPSPTGLRAHTYVAAFGLLAVTGLRVAELVALDDQDTDLTRGHVTIRRGKFGKSRLLPVHPTTQQALRHYVAARDRCYPIPQSPSFLVSEQGARLTHWSVRATFVALSRQIGLRGPADSHGPRLHDLRHRFAVEALLRWYRQGADVERHLPELSTYLGHVKVADTYWYLSATPELLQLALDRLEHSPPPQGVGS
jgi:site-specific recombinase XerD